MTQDKKDDCKTGACPVDKSNQEKKMVKNSDLPLVGNPYPPKDVIIDEQPGFIELGVRKIRTTMQPFMSPVCSAYNRTRDIFSIGVAHSQSALENLTGNSEPMTGALVISSSAIIGFALTRKRGIFTKIIVIPTAVTIGYGIWRPQFVEDKLGLALFIAKNKLPDLTKQQYEKFIKGTSDKESTDRT